jgi:iron-sulfur cluster assembly accessory protein
MVSSIEPDDMYLLIAFNLFDRTFEKDGIKLLVDEITLDMLNGSTIDYKQEMMRSSFEIQSNPNADSGCSCGVSFSPKDK